MNKIFMLLLGTAFVLLGCDSSTDSPEASSTNESPIINAKKLLPELAFSSSDSLDGFQINEYPCDPIVIEPDTSSDYTIRQITPDESIDYTLKIHEPGEDWCIAQATPKIDQGFELVLPNIEPNLNDQ